MLLYELIRFVPLLRENCTACSPDVCRYASSERFTNTSAKGEPSSLPITASQRMEHVRAKERIRHRSSHQSTRETEEPSLLWVPVQQSYFSCSWWWWCLSRGNSGLSTAWWRASRVVVHVAKERPDGRSRSFIFPSFPCFDTSTLSMASFIVPVCLVQHLQPSLPEYANRVHV